MMHDSPCDSVSAFSLLLLSWYDHHARVLPWRGSKNPYLIWVSEIIFQQTRIEQGLDYYLRFVERFPTLASLAAAEEDEVLRLWQGLGYYSRAHHLLMTARSIQDRFAGCFPEDFQEVSRLKGIGDYTASCITSICFGQTQAAVDGNVLRVLSRFFADPTPIDSQMGRKHFKKIAQQLISSQRPGDFNEALMDLGATVCKPRNPSCCNCPLKDRCAACKISQQMLYPVKPPAIKKKRIVLNYLLMGQKGLFLIRKRPEKGIWKGLYELPLILGEPDLKELVEAFIREYHFNLEQITELRRIRHKLTHAELDIRFYQADAMPEILAKNLLIISLSEIDDYPFPKPIADFLQETRKGMSSL